jgi:hypothetical protein
MYLRVVVKLNPEIDTIDIERIGNVQVVMKEFFPSETSNVEKSVQMVVVIKMGDQPDRAQRQFLDNLIEQEVIEEYHFYDNGDHLLW